MTSDTNKKSLPPEESIRSDLWSTMSMSQLYRQQEMVLDQINKLRLISSQATTGQLALATALQQAMRDLNELIDAKAMQSQRKIT